MGGMHLCALRDVHKCDKMSIGVCCVHACTLCVCVWVLRVRVDLFDWLVGRLRHCLFDVVFVCWCVCLFVALMCLCYVCQCCLCCVFVVTLCFVVTALLVCLFFRLLGCVCAAVCLINWLVVCLLCFCVCCGRSCVASVLCMTACGVVCVCNCVVCRHVLCPFVRVFVRVRAFVSLIGLRPPVHLIVCLVVRRFVRFGGFVGPVVCLICGCLFVCLFWYTSSFLSPVSVRMFVCRVCLSICLSAVLMMCLSYVLVSAAFCVFDSLCVSCFGPIISLSRSLCVFVRLFRYLPVRHISPLV